MHKHKNELKMSVVLRPQSLQSTNLTDLISNRKLSISSGRFVVVRHLWLHFSMEINTNRWQIVC